MSSFLPKYLGSNDLFYGGDARDMPAPLSRVIENKFTV